MRLLIAVLMLVLASGRASAGDPEICAIPGYLTIVDSELSRVAAAVKAGRLNIAVVGSGSSLIGGPDGRVLSYPARLERALIAKLPSVAIKTVSVAKSRVTAEGMVKDLERLLADEKPDLVVWQTGTVDAMRGVEVDDFGAVLESGIAAAQAGGADVILVNQQYSPRTESMIAVGPYADAMRVVAQQASVPLFDRLSIMRHWNDVGQFDFYATSKSNALAKTVHDCLGRALANLVIEAARIVPPRAESSP